MLKTLVSTESPRLALSRGQDGHLDQTDHLVSSHLQRDPDQGYPEGSTSKQGKEHHSWAVQVLEGAGRRRGGVLEGGLSC